VEQLRANLKADGCREPLVIWPTSAGPILLDGHNRYEICQQQNIHFDTVEIELASREEAATWIINNQLGRRNLTSEQASYLRGKRYNREKKPVGPPTKQFPHFEGITADKLATEYKVSRATIERDGQFAAAVDTLASNVGEDVKQQILTRDAPLSKDAAVTLAKRAEEDPDQVRQTIERARSGVVVVASTETDALEPEIVWGSEERKQRRSPRPRAKALNDLAILGWDMSKLKECPTVEQVHEWGELIIRLALEAS